MCIEPITVGQKRGKDGDTSLQPMEIDESGGVLKRVKSAEFLETYVVYEQKVASPTNRVLGSQ